MLKPSKNHDSCLAKSRWNRDGGQVSVKKILTVVSLLFMLITINLYGNFVDVETAKEIANNWYEYWSPKEINHFDVKEIFTKEYNNHPSFYIFTFEPGGFVIVSADDATIPILGYSFISEAKEDITHPAVKEWMDNYHRQIDYVITQNIDNSETIDLWQNILGKDFSGFDNGKDVLPLLSTTWNQNWPYNELCPADISGPNGHAYAGCVATAMGQVMKYHNHPMPGVSLHSYIHTTYGSLSADFSTTNYDWMNMPDYISSSNMPIATLLYHSGIAVDMDYGPSGSGASIVFAIIALRTYFNYDTSLQLVYKADYLVLDWENLLKYELDNSRPMLYAGVNPASPSGHAFVCDGYQSTNYFHFNWGWSGSYDGYYYLNSLCPGTHNYTNDQQAIIGFIPNTSSYVYPLFSGFEYSKYDWTIIDNDGDGNKWKRYGEHHTGVKCIGVQANPAGSDDWLITRQLGLSDNSMINFSFWARSWYPANQDFNVRLSTTGNNISDFTTTLDSVSGAPISWTEYYYDLSSYAGQNIYLAVQCVSINDDYLMADDFVVAVNCYPVADAGTDTTANMGVLVTLDGSDSYDPYGGSINYDWSAPAGITLSDSTIVNPTFTTPTVGDSTDYAFILIVDDGIIYSEPDTIVVTVIPFGIDDEILYPLSTYISENYPNPFNQATTIKYALRENSKISIEIYNIRGQKIKTLIDSKMKSGSHCVFWDGKDEKGRAVPSGIYFYKMSAKGVSAFDGKTDNYNKVRKMIMLR
ncbi:MAG: C10 family peptidase [Candidatus Cloacimonetes bacterium]|nr:C10 family peptidase [Candidatus Cloacimonadota bacterium]